MAYLCDIGSGQQIYLDNMGEQTSIVCATHQSGQQQQSGSSFTTGAWTEPPQLFRTPQGMFIKLTTARGGVFIQVQGQVGQSQSLQMSHQAPGMQQAQPMQVIQTSAMPGTNAMPPMQPIEMRPMTPMQPMSMGNMRMNMNPMQMQMGDMQMQMGKPIATAPATPTAETPEVTTRRFCPSCGSAVKPDDRFCSSCGKSLAQ